MYCEEHRITEDNFCTATVKPTRVTLKTIHGTGIFYKDQKIKEAISEEPKAPFQNWMIWTIL
ncbi:MAG: hypothetical protein ACFE9T_06040 [Promethearchaeota archaeon]